MRTTCDGEALRKTLAVFHRLDSGWKPGKAELDCARFIEDWTILPLKDGAPFRMIGSSWTLPVSNTLVVATIFAVDWKAHWARTLDEWVVVGDPIDGSTTFDAGTIRRTGEAWLWTELQRLPASA